MPNLFALLDIVQRAGDAEATIELASLLHQLLQTLGKRRLLEQVDQICDAAATVTGNSWNHAKFEAARIRIEEQLGTGRLREALTGAQQLLQRARTADVQGYLYADYDLALACIIMAHVLSLVGRTELALPLVDEARHRFEAIAVEHPSSTAEGMAAACFMDKGEYLSLLGRLEEALTCFEEGIRRNEKLGDDRNIAVGKVEIGTILRQQHRCSEALVALGEALQLFTMLKEPISVASIWHTIGMVYEETGEHEEAEDAYRKSIEINVRLGNLSGQAGTLLQLGNLYDKRGRTEEAANFYRRSSEKFSDIGDGASEGQARSGLASAFRKLGRLEEARQEIRCSLEFVDTSGHGIQPWKFWGILFDIETDAANPVAANGARCNAITCYLAYRRDGGENHHGEGRVSLAVTESLLEGNEAAAAILLQQLASNPDIPSLWSTFIRALQDIVDGSRNRSLADHPDLDYMMAAEILLLIEKLESAASKN